MKYFIELNEVGDRFEVVYFENERKTIDFGSKEDALVFIGDCDFSQAH